MKIFYSLLLIFVIQYLTACGGGGNKSETQKSTGFLSSQGIQVSSASSINSSVSSSSAVMTTSSDSSIMSTLVISVNEKSIDQPVLDIGYIPELVETGESYAVYWTAYSTEGALENVVWEQLAGPEVNFLKRPNSLLIKFGQPGDVLLRASVTDNKYNSIVRDINVKVSPLISEKAQLISGSSTGVGLDLVIVGDGFLAEDQNKLKQAAYEIVEFLFEYDNKILNPYKPLVNIWLVESVSNTRTISDTLSNDTLLGGYFNCNNTPRALCVINTKTIQFVSHHVPQYDLVLALVNSDRYGGTASGPILTASLNADSKHIVIHELGHSLAKLADEYTTNDGQRSDVFEPLEPNVTINTNPRSVKWNYWYDDIQNIPGVDRFIFAESDIGYFEGAKYHDVGIWRPTKSSFMRDRGMPMGAVNAEAMALSMWHYFHSDNLTLPKNKLLTQSDVPVIFHIRPPLDVSNMHIQWWVNDELVAGSGKEFFLILNQIDQSIKSVRVQLEDATGLIRRHSDQSSKINYEWVTE